MANGTEVGKAYVQIMPSAEGLSGSISDLMSGEASKAGESAGGSFSGAFAGALKGTGAVLAGTAVAIGGVTAALVEGVSSTAEYADNIDKASQKLGISSTAYQEWDAVLKHSGTSMDAMSATFKTLAKASQDATDDQAEAFKKLGLSLDEIGGMSADELFGSVIAGLQNMEEGTERTAIASILLGRGAMEMGALLNTSAEDTQAMIDTVHELGGVLDEDAIKNGAAFTDSLQDLNTAMEGLKNGAMAQLLPSFTEVIDGLTAIFSGDESGIGKIAKGIGGISEKILSALPTILQTGSQIVQSLATAIIENLPAIANTAITIITELAGYLIDNLDLLIDVTYTVIETLIEGLTQALPNLLNKALEIIPKVVSTVTTRFPMLLKTGIELIMELVKGIIQALPSLIEEAPTIINEFVGALLEMLDVVIDAGVQLISALTGPEALPQIIDAIVSVVPEIITSLLMALIELYPKVISAGMDLFMCLLQNMPDIYIKVGEAVFELINNLIDALVQKWPDIQTAGLNALSELFSKMSDVLSLAKDKAKEIVNTIVDKFKSMASDFKEIGSWILEKIFDGISEGAGWLKDKLDGFIGGLTGGKGTQSTNAVNSINSAGFNSAMDTLNTNASFNTNAEISVSNSRIDAVYGLLATYLPQIAEGENVTVEVNADANNIFEVMQKRSREYKTAKGISAFA